MTKGQILQRVFIRFLIKQSFDKCEFMQIWNLFVEKKSRLNSEDNFQFIKKFFKQYLEKDYFLVDRTYTPFKYTSAYTKYQLSKFFLPEELQSSYESINQEYEILKKIIFQKDLEIKCLKEYLNKFPALRFQIEILIYQREDEHFRLQSKENVLNELIQSFI